MCVAVCVKDSMWRTRCRWEQESFTNVVCVAVCVAVFVMCVAVCVKDSMWRTRCRWEQESFTHTIDWWKSFSHLWWFLHTESFTHSLNIDKKNAFTCVTWLLRWLLQNISTKYFHKIFPQNISTIVWKYFGKYFVEFSSSMLKECVKDSMWRSHHRWKKLLHQCSPDHYYGQNISTKHFHKIFPNNSGNILWKCFVEFFCKSHLRSHVTHVIASWHTYEGVMSHTHTYTCSHTNTHTHIYTCNIRWT